MWRRTKESSDCAKDFEPSYLSCLAKTHRRDDERIGPGRTVLEHCSIVGKVARALIARYPLEIGEALFPKNAHFAAACHDIGKVSPCFYEKIRSACDQSLCSLKRLPNINFELESRWGGHAGVSQVTATALEVPHYVPEILGQHHGFSPNVDGKRALDDIFGGLSWQRERILLVEKLKEVLNADWPKIETVPQARLVAGLTSVSDWIGSGSFFENPTIPWETNIEKALDDAGFVSAQYKQGLSFEDVFGFSTRSAQKTLIEHITGPGVYVLEAPMGMGKTEAALFAAYKLLESGQASGIYFALPTQLTSNKIYERFNRFLDVVLAEGCGHRSLLLHSKAWLIATEMGEDAKPGGAWFNASKRGLLAPFAVGTIDQALMAAMNVKHGFVRAFGLAGKVVILDEVHTYDAYTSTLLDALVSLLRQLHCTVIILTATLNKERREKLLSTEAYTNDYPLITSMPADSKICEVSIQSTEQYTISLHQLHDEKLAVNEALERASNGQQVLWIENTVHESQERYLDLAARAADLGIECGLLHSRFTNDDRQSIEDRWVSLFGKSGWDERKNSGRVLVGTQVLEQSLDIDADFLVTRFAPTDMLLQRVGRLWRHEGAPRPDGARCETWVIAPSLEAAISSPLAAFGNTAHVYSPYVLCRSLEVWQGRTSLTLPSDIRSLIEATYASRREDGSMARYLDELDNGTSKRIGRKALSQLAQVTLASSGKTLSEAKAQTRYSEVESVEVLLLRKIELQPASRSTNVVLLNGEELTIPWGIRALERRAWNVLSAKLMRQTVLVRPNDAPLPSPIKSLEKFGIQNCFYLGEPSQDESILRLALVDYTGVLIGLQGAEVKENSSFEYRGDIGYRLIKS